MAAVTMGSAIRTHSLSKKKNSLSCTNRPADAASEMVHGRARFVISRRGVREIVGRVELRAVPQLIQISVKLVGAGFRDVVDLRRSIPSLIDGIGKRVDRHFRDGIQSEHEVGRKPAVQIGQRVVGFESIDDVAVRESGQSVELHIAVAVRAADKIVSAARRVDERARWQIEEGRSNRRPDSEGFPVRARLASLTYSHFPG